MSQKATSQHKLKMTGMGNYDMTDTILYGNIRETELSKAQFSTNTDYLRMWRHCCKVFEEGEVHIDLDTELKELLQILEERRREYQLGYLALIQFFLSYQYHFTYGQLEMVRSRLQEEYEDSTDKEARKVLDQIVGTYFLKQ